MLLLCFVLICVSQSLLAVELSIYNSFTQVRQNHNGSGDYIYEFTNGEYENLIDGSINWDGTPFIKQELYDQTQSLENVKVLVRRSSTCECDNIEAKIIDPSTMLLQNLKTGSYFYADKQSIEYLSTRPNQQRKILNFQFGNGNKQYQGKLSYLINGVTWKPDYDLFINGNNESILRSYANIKNEQDREYEVDNTYLLGGDVQLVNGNNIRGGGSRFADKSPAIMESIHFQGEQQGVYSYQLKDKYKLRPSSSVRLPFIDINTKYEFYYKASVNLGTQQYQGIFSKYYGLTPDQFMPTGVITIYDNQLLVGQANLPDVPKNFKQTISLGQDVDIRYLINANLTAKSNENATIQTETYDVDVKLINYKNKKVDAQFVLNGGVQFILHHTTCKTAQIKGNQLILSTQLEQGENSPCKLNLTINLS